MTSVAVAVAVGPIIRFAKEPQFNLKHLVMSLSSPDDDEENIPFTTSPLDDSRGYAFKKTETELGEPHVKKQKTNKKTATRR